MPAPLVGHLVARAGPPPRRGLGYDYLLAGDGVYLATENAVLSVRVPVACCTIRGLPPLSPAFSLTHGRLPQALWVGIVRLARLCAAPGLEVLLLVVYDAAAGGYRLVVPPQTVSATAVRYELPDGAPVVLALHSHHRFGAYFSGTDDADEQGVGLYGVVGRLDTPRPEVALRVGAYGHWLPLPWEAVFAGDRGDFRDAHVEPPDGEWTEAEDRLAWPARDVKAESRSGVENTPHDSKEDSDGLPD